MKNAFKSGFAALLLSATIAACGDGDKSKTNIDSSATTVKVDSASTTKVDTAGVADTTTNKTSTTVKKTETKKN